ncbi:WD-REPEATS-REGION domain-containing protein [Mycena sanguinolenta]|uniref:WD-REPEATS-REGION domain-containing protein n=1 Tax=Mycena sanguinolenta TaxID=230812 RepID=A0A8H7DCE9_9AGAR|nr:WD-REPEATS-REGION domain-containing protein [Mycena sanguinolenta]
MSASRFTLKDLEEDGLHKNSRVVPDLSRELESSGEEFGRSTMENFYGNISGGIGGRGGFGGKAGGSGGRGEGPVFIGGQQIFHSSTAVANSLKDLGLKYVSARHNAAETTAQKCMKGTRVKIIQDIIEQLTHPPSLSVRLVLCSGPAGSGKSTIAKTVAAQLEEEKKLAASFFFSRDYAECKEIKYIPSTLAHQLADYNLEFQALLVKLLKDDHSRLIYADPKEQFQKMVVQLLAQMPPSKTPWVICLDALDECGKDHGKILLHWLSESISDIPVHIRFFVTGRPEVQNYLQSSRLSFFCKYISTEDIGLETVKQDIHLYVTKSLHNDIWNMSPGGWKIKEQDVNKITSQADRLFIVAATAVRYVRTRAELGVHPQKSIDNLLKGNTHLKSLYDLYFQIIEEAIGIPVGNDPFEHIGKVLGAIVNLVEPQDIKTLADLLEINIEELRWTLIHLSAVLSVPDHGNVGVIKIRHLSFREFLTVGIGEKQPGLLCGTAAQQQYLVLNTFRVMQKELKFNICHLPTSHLQNIDIPDLEESKQKYIQSHLAYSSRFWATHLAASPYSIKLAQITGSFVLDYFLFWLEVLSLIGAVGSAADSLSKFIKWASESIQDPIMVDTIEFMHDGKRFITFFRDPIVQSAPHIYLSALALAPEQSQIVKHFHPQFPHLLSAGIGQMDVWPATTLVLERHTGPVISVAFSPNGKWIVSGTEDGTVCVWDAENGEMVTGPINGHTNRVNSVAFSPDSKQIVSSSNDNTVHIWDAESGEVVVGPFRGHTDWVNSVAFSPNGKQIVSGSHDNTICVWNAENGEMITGPINGHTSCVNSVAFSPDGKQIVSGSGDNTVCVWDAESGEMVGSPFNGHTDQVRSVGFSPDGKQIVSGSDDHTGHTDHVYSTAFSPDGKWIVSGSRDNTVCVWDAESREVVAGPFKGHTNSVMSVTFSPDCKWIVSGSFDKTVRMWNSETGKVVADIFDGHTDNVYSVAFSPNGKQIVSGSADNTVLVWDAESGKVVCGPFKGHTEWVESVAFSPDGKWIVSGSRDNTVCVWDAETGEVVVG